MTTSTSSATTISSTSLSGLGIAGLSSGLDTTGIITALMNVESAPKTALQTQLTNATTLRTTLQSLNSSIAAIATAATSAAASGALTAYSASSDTTGVTAAASASASAGSVSFTVDKLAQAQVSVTDAMSTWTGGSSFQLQVGSGTAVTITPASTSMDDVVSAINSAAAGVTATKVQSGTDTSGNALYRIQLRSATTGAANGFAITPASGSTINLTQITAAQNAQLTLYSGSSAASSITSSTNTFSSLLTGVDVTVSATTASTSPATITVAPDSTAATSAASTITSDLISLFSSITSLTSVSSTTSSSGSTTDATGSTLTGDLQTRQIKDSLLSAISDPVNNTSLSSIGITLTKDGTITFDQSAFAAAMAKDPTGTMSAFQTAVGRVATAATTVSDPYTGTLTNRITSEQSDEKSLTTKISDWTTRLTQIQANYEAQFNDTRDRPLDPELAGELPDQPDQRSPDHLQLGQPPMRNDFAAARSMYNRDSVLSASPARILTMLYDRLLLDLQRAEAAQVREDWQAASPQLKHAQDIVAELVNSLRPELWDGGPALMSVYGYAQKALIAANMTRDVAKTRECIALLEPLREAWHEAEKQVSVVAPSIEKVG